MFGTILPVQRQKPKPVHINCIWQLALQQTTLQQVARLMEKHVCQIMVTVCNLIIDLLNQWSLPSLHANLG